MATMTKSKTFQPLRKNPSRYSQSFIAISLTKIVSAMVSRTRKKPPACAMANGQVSRPRAMALIRMTRIIVVLNHRDSTICFTIPASEKKA